MFKTQHFFFDKDQTVAVTLNIKDCRCWIILNFCLVLDQIVSFKSKNAHFQLYFWISLLLSGCFHCMKSSSQHSPSSLNVFCLHFDLFSFVQTNVKPDMYHKKTYINPIYMPVKVYYPLLTLCCLFHHVQLQNYGGKCVWQLSFNRYHWCCQPDW